MAEQENLRTVQSAYQAFGSGDLPAVLATLDDSIEWVIPGPSDLPIAGTMRGKQEVQTWFEQLGQHLQIQRLEPYDFIAQGDKVVALLHGEYTIPHNGRRVTDELAHVFTVQNGKITRFQEFADTEAIASAHRG